MKKMLFETSLSGHRMEYIHHLYMEMQNHNEDQYFIVVTEDFNKKSSDYNWPESPNITFVFIPQGIADDANSGNMIAQARKKSNLLRWYIKKYDAQRIFLITLMQFMPFLPFVLPRGCEIISIVYKIYLYEWNQYSITKRAKNIVLYKLIVWSKAVRTVFVLNDEASARYLNNLYKTQKFQYLVDPFNKLECCPHDIRADLNIPSGNRVLLHFGGLTWRKGTMEIIKAIGLLNAEERENITIILAGKVYDNMREAFYEKVEKSKDLCQILLFDEFCSVEFLSNLCYSCDQILIPYKVTALSSGLLGYAAYFKKPVLGPRDGLIGKLIRKYNLGFTMPNVNASTIAEAIKLDRSFNPDDRYAEKNQVKTFIEQIFCHF